MKKGVLVTEKNLSTIFDHVKKAIEGKYLIKTRNIYTKSIKKVNLLVNGSFIGSSAVVGKSGEVITSKQTQFTLISVKIERSFTWSPKFIAVRDYKQTGHLIIEPGNKIFISKGMIFVYKHEPLIYGYPGHIEVCQF